VTNIGNFSNKKGGFNIIKMEIALFPLFPYITPKRNVDPLLAHGQDFTGKLLGVTSNLKNL
jgi:hypothetical protein